jgi:hypothetical protein
MAPKSSKRSAKVRTKCEVAKGETVEIAEYKGKDEDKLQAQLKPVGKYLQNVGADGKCLARALADQVFGDETRYQEILDAIVDTMLNNRDEFEPFHTSSAEEGKSFNERIQFILSDGKWLGDLELSAFLKRHRRNAIIHHADQAPNVKMVGPPDAAVIQLAYDGQHYYSVRDRLDPSPGLPARHLTLQEMEDLAKKHEDAKQIDDSTRAELTDRFASTTDASRVTKYLQECATATSASLATARGDATKGATRDDLKLSAASVLTRLASLLSCLRRASHADSSAVGEGIAEAKDKELTRSTDSGPAPVQSKAERKRLKDAKRKQQKAAEWSKGTALLGNLLISV